MNSVVGIQAQLTLLAFLVVMLVVPFIMSGEASARDRDGEGYSRNMSPGFPFRSRRERRLWIWLLAVLVAIYSTLSPAQRLAAELRERDLLGTTSTAVLVLLALVIALRWVGTRPGRREMGAAVGVAAVYLTTTIRLPVPEARSHLFEYGLVALLVYHALVERRRNGGRVPIPAVIAVIATSLLGWIDEAIQAFLPNRVYDIVDVGFNALAGMLAVLASLLMTWARSRDLFRPRRGQRPDPDG